MSAAKSTWTPPEEFAEYRVVRLLGEGAMGKVFLAHDTVLDRPVAVKFLGSDLGGPARDRFLIEARALARLQHPNVVAVYRVGDLGSRPYLVSEFVHGQSLDKVAKPLPWKQVLELAIGLARGLAAAHRRGVLHRDIKPGNTILTDTNEVKLLDFGLAKFTDNTRRADESSPDGSLSSSKMRLTPVPTAPREQQFDATASPDASPDQTAALPKPSAGIGAETVASTDNDGAGNGSGNGSGNAGDKSGDHGSSPSLTRVGALLGTPYYMAPEVWRAEPATERSDIYSLGALLFELLAGVPPHRSSVMGQLAGIVQDVDAPSLVDLKPGIQPGLATIIARCLSRDASARFASADALRAELEVLQTPGSLPIALPEGNPYPGLHAFGASQQALFFGRDAEVRAVVERVRADHFVVVAGDSGIGKSSLCHAGVGPAIAAGALGGKRAWQTIAMNPWRRPISALVTAISTTFGLDSIAFEKALASRDPTESTAQRHAILRALGTDRGVLLIVDHLEELVTIAPKEEAHAIAEFLAELLAARSPGFRMLGVVRGDYLARVANLPGLGEGIARSLYMLQPMTTEGIARAISRPVEAKGGRFEPESMVDELVAAAETHGGLPLVQFALAELWNARTADNVITAEALQKLGGVAGALTRHADTIINGLRGIERKEASRMLLALIAADGSRVQRTHDDLVGGSRTAEITLDALLKGRLVAIREDEGAPTYEIAHDALIQQWDRLRRWLDDDGERRIIRRRIEDATTEWQRLGRSPEALWRDRQLVEAERVPDESISDNARAFRAASRAAVRRARLRKLAFAIGIPLAIVGAIVFVRMRIQAGERSRIAAEMRERDRRVAIHVDEAAKLLAGSSEATAMLRAQQQAAYARFDARELAVAEAEWAKVLARSRELDAMFSQSSAELEHALVIDPTRDDVRKRLAEILHHRAQLANDFHNAERRDELLRRLPMYDTANTFVATWKAPATLAVDITPAGAKVEIATIERRGFRRVEGEPRPLDPRAVIAPNDYIITASAPGKANVRFPIRTRPGETLAIAFALPPENRIPSGFVYIPAGRFLVGTADEGARTSFLSTVPLHDARTGAFLIAKYETTFGQWIEFLDAISSEERERHRPRTAGMSSISGGWSNMGGQVEIVKTDRWMLAIKPTTHLYNAMQGEPLQYLDRATRTLQDWSKLPVLGVSLEGVQAYTKWLTTTGKVSGARPCSELEWERAARGADDREFPNGDALDIADANFDETYGKRTRAFGPDEIGSYTSRSPFGIQDMAGNAFEWTLTSLSSHPGTMRGGAYYFGALTARLTNRNTLEPTARSIELGVRVCADAPE